jgi:hypothetical protein
MHRPVSSHLKGMNTCRSLFCSDIRRPCCRMTWHKSLPYFSWVNVFLAKGKEAAFAKFRHKYMPGFTPPPLPWSRLSVTRGRMARGFAALKRRLSHFGWTTPTRQLWSKCPKAGCQNVLLFKWISGDVTICNHCWLCLAQEYCFQLRRVDAKCLKQLTAHIWG